MYVSLKKKDVSMNQQCVAIHRSSGNQWLHTRVPEFVFAGSECELESEDFLFHAHQAASRDKHKNYIHRMKYSPVHCYH